MANITTETDLGKLTVGLDMGDRFTQVCVLDEGGEIIEEARVMTTPKAFRRGFAAMPPARIVLIWNSRSTPDHWGGDLCWK